MTDNLVERLRKPEIAYEWETHEVSARDAADVIERLRLELDAVRTASHESMWRDTLIPLSEAAGVSLVGLDGNKRQFQMVEDLVAEIERLRAVVDAMLDRPFRGDSEQRRYRMYGSDWEAVHEALDAWEANRD